MPTLRLSFTSFLECSSQAHCRPVCGMMLHFNTYSSWADTFRRLFAPLVSGYIFFWSVSNFHFQVENNHATSSGITIGNYMMQRKLNIRQRVLNDIQRAKLSCGRIIVILAAPPPLLPSVRSTGDIIKEWFQSQGGIWGKRKRTARIQYSVLLRSLSISP